MTHRDGSRSKHHRRGDARRHAVAAVLARHGLVRRIESPIQTREEIPWGSRLADACRELGPAFVVFGHYLSQRPDRLPIEDVLALAELTPADVALPPPLQTPEAVAELLARIERELDRSPGLVFAQLDPAPCHLGFLRVDYSAGLVSGEDVIVRLRRPGIEGFAESRDDVLSDLGHLRPAFGLIQARFERDETAELLADFAVWLEHRLDLRAEALALKRLAEDLVDGESLAVPRFDLDLCTPGLSVRQDRRGQVLRSYGRVDEHGGPASRRSEALRRLHLGWLQQLLVSGEAALDAQWSELDDGRLALEGGRGERVAAASLPRLWSYLQHVAAHRPEAAFAAIAGELRPRRGDADERRLRLAMRQVVPFRDGGWTERCDTVAELLVLHWRLIRVQGFETSPALGALYAGTFQVAAIARSLRVEGDPLRSALEDLRWLANWRRLRTLADPRGLGDAMEQNLAGLLDMPQKLDRLLDLAAGEGDRTRSRTRLAGQGAPSDRNRGLTRAACLALLMVALTLVAGRLSDLGVSAEVLGTWIEPAIAVFFLALGALLLRNIVR